MNVNEILLIDYDFINIFKLLKKKINVEVEKMKIEVVKNAEENLLSNKLNNFIEKLCELDVKESVSSNY